MHDENAVRSEMSRPLFTVSNHHSSHCGPPPSVNGDEDGIYHGYFENRHGEQFVFEYRRESGEAVIRCGDAHWEETYPVTNGLAESLILSDEEIMWLRACWKAAAS